VHYERCAERARIRPSLCENRPAPARTKVSLDPDKKNKGDPVMGDARFTTPRGLSFRDLVLDRVHRLVTGSLTLYLAATAAQRTWELLNSDVGLLLRRMQ
jgi:hypothetical protein